MTAPAAPPTSVAPPRADVILLGVAVLAVSTSAPLIRQAAAPTLAIAMWRNVLAVPVIAPFALRSRAPSPGDRRLIVASGLLLGVHFAAWVPSLSYTSVASSVALVATQPVWAALIARWRGEPIERSTWLGIGIALVGVLLLTGVDVSISARAAFGDLLALAGGMFAAAYVTVGAEVRKRVDTSVLATGSYTVAGMSLLAVCLVSRQDLWGYDVESWLAIAGLVVFAQLLGHTLFNRVLRTISATAVSVTILFEVVGASLLAFAWFGETPPPAAAPAGLLILTGVAVVIRSGRTKLVPGG